MGDRDHLVVDTMGRTVDENVNMLRKLLARSLVQASLSTNIDGLPKRNAFEMFSESTRFPPLLAYAMAAISFNVRSMSSSTVSNPPAPEPDLGPFHFSRHRVRPMRSLWSNFLWRSGLPRSASRHRRPLPQPGNQTGQKFFSALTPRW